jgi:A1 cistron-splicing factor AAR2
VRKPPYREPEISVAKWDAETEELAPETNPSELLRWRANLGSVWKQGLFTYRQRVSRDEADADAAAWEEKGDWENLTTHISESLLSRVLGNRQKGHWGWEITSGSSAKCDADDLPGITGQSQIQQEKELQFLPIDLKNTWRIGATGRERTEGARDRSWALGELQRQCTDKLEILGELELSFLMALILGNFSCLEQWKRILSLIFTCKRAVEQQPELFIEAIRTLKVQLQHSEDAEGGLLDFREDGALIKGLLRKFKKGLEEISGEGKLDVVEELDELQNFLKSEFDWEIDDSFLKKGLLELEDGEKVEMQISGYEEDEESGEYAPTVVDLTAAQRKALGHPEQGSDEQDNDIDGTGTTPSSESDEEDHRNLEELDARY